MIEKLTRHPVYAIIAVLIAAAPLSFAYANETDSSTSSATEASAATRMADRAADLVMRALSLVGVHYKRGGSSPQTGLDCSGLVSLVYRDTLGLILPRRSEEISRIGEKINARDLQPGDLVFFNTLRRAFSHVGIYLGEGRFVHAPARGGSVRVESMNMPYWSKRFNGARRVPEQG